MDTSTLSLSAELLLKFLADHSRVQFVRLLWLDYNSVLRARIVTTSHFCHLIQRGELQGLANLYMFLAHNQPPSLDDGGDWSPGQAWLLPDPVSIRLCPGADSHAQVFCFFVDEVETPWQLQLGHDDSCPRIALARAVRDAQHVIGAEFLVGFEIEFVCSLGPGTVIPQSCPHESSGVRTTEIFMMPILCEIVDALRCVGISVQQFHAECTVNQYEIALVPMSPLEAVDTLVITRETIWKICHVHGVAVSFSPAHPEENGVHLNLSIHGRQPADSATTDYFLAGILSHLVSLCAFGLPRITSYDRIAAGPRCFGRYKAWGTQNRMVPVRKRSAALWELRFLDADSNFFLFLSAVLYSGISGVRQKLPLTLKDCRGMLQASLS
ncbi:hypothetical protein B0T10DRAFT_416493 [Thelonectria olida]|uniref:Glutamine synthetase n=1 Tax=Thelonectria olida TaxID=1576542 RepID=A0A9P8VQZ6_9HYPO|nr:hypothetical protein B0T10DRAFT_416493 [Thelonectria olida]